MGEMEWRNLNFEGATLLSLAVSTWVCKTNNQMEHTIEWLAQDYIKHLLHHLHQVLDSEPVDYP
jgi:hypothetical protein